MKLPTLSAHSVSRDMISTFGGYHHHSTVPDNSFFDMKNLSADHYPALSVRRARGIFKDSEVTAPSAMIYTDRLCYVDGSALVIGAERIECGLSTASSMLPKKLVSMGTYIIVFPDHYYVNMADTSDQGAIETRFSSYVSLTYCNYTIGYCDENGATAASGSGYFILNCYTNYTSEGESESISKAGFRVGQSLKAEALSSDPNFEYHLGIPSPEILTKTETIYTETQFPEGESIKIPIGERTLYAVKYYDISNAVVYALQERAIIFKGVYREIISEYTERDLSAYDYGFTLVGDPIPEMDHVFEHENRLWGCRYGRNVFGELVNEIYASALGSFRDFSKFEGVSTDAYKQGVGTEGPFTGACSLNGYPIFFKEKCYHKVYGSYPAQYQVKAVECKGIQQGSSDSTAMINGVLYYKAVDAVCSFDGSYPTDISYSLGDCRYADAVGGAHRYKYYLSMRDIDTDEWSLFVYDARYGLWHKEDELRAVCFCDTMRALYCIPASGDCILDVTGGDAGGEAVIPWSFETGMITSETVDRKFLRDISVRLSLAVGGVLFAFIEYDSSGRWEYLFRIPGTSTNTFTIPITPQRCDHFRLKFSGTGDMKLFALAKSYTKGSAY
ncbi:MAG: hypothetical protein IKC26_01865 [Clostridia bacterium]|nr:hypothetical protein [Clostridia bacterium]